MAHMIETMAYAGETPWHGLGVRVDDNMTPEEMLNAAGLSWDVIKEPLYLQGEHPDSSDRGFSRVPDTIGGMLVRASDRKILGFAGPDYTPHQNLDVFRFFDKFVKAGKMKMHTAGSIKGGQEVWGLAALEKGFTLAGGDEVNGYLLLSIPHIWGKATTKKFTAVRVVCNNTVQMALRDQTYGSGFRISHSNAYDADIMKQAEEALGLSDAAFAEFKESAEFLASKRYTDENLRRYIIELVQPELLGKKTAAEGLFANCNLSEADLTQKGVKRNVNLLYSAAAQSPGAELNSAKGTWWGAFNGVTFCVDHKLGNGRDTALQSAWFGTGASMKSKAMVKALEYARAA